MTGGANVHTIELYDVASSCALGVSREAEVDATDVRFHEVLLRSSAAGRAETIRGCTRQSLTHMHLLMRPGVKGGSLAFLEKISAARLSERALHCGHGARLLPFVAHFSLHCLMQSVW